MIFQKVIIVNKKEGETPLETLDYLRARNKIYRNEKMTYAGRLDPMASGLLLVLVGDECKNKEKYLALDKEYEFEVLFGFSTDTYDILGKINHSNILMDVVMLDSEKELKKKIKDNLKKFTGKFVQKYPAYSSKTVKGKPLFEYAREGKEVETQSREVVVKSLKFIKLRKITSKKLLENIEKRIAKVGGDFRQKEILSIWNKHQHASMVKSYSVASFKIKCSSGTYVRSISNSLGEAMGIPDYRTPQQLWITFKTHQIQWFCI